MNRRQVLTGLISLVAAPAIVRVGSIMPVRTIVIQRQILTSVIGKSLNAEEVAQFYARLKLYMDEVIPGWNEPDLLHIYATED